MKKIFLATILFVGSPMALANQDSLSSSLEFSREEVRMAPRGLLPFLSLGGGYTGYDSANYAEGTPATLKLLGSYYFENPTVVDIGYGINNQQFSQSEGTGRDSAITDGSLELALRYRFESRWQAGVVADHLFSQGKFYGSDQGDAQFVGLQALREFNVSPSWLARVGARAQALTNGTDGYVGMYMIDLQLGWNPVAYQPSARQAGMMNRNPNYAADDGVTRETFIEEDTFITPATPPARPVANRPRSALQNINYASLSGGTTFQFNTAKSTLSMEEQRKLNQIAKVLADNKDLYERVEVRGYADSTGSRSINQRISQERANSVRSILRRNGVNDVVAMGKGATNSIGSRPDDRRAELVFIGVKDKAKLEQALSSVE